MKTLKSPVVVSGLVLALGFFTLTFVPLLAMGDLVSWARKWPGMMPMEAPQVEPPTTLRKLTLPKPSGLGTYGQTVAAQLEIFKQSAEDGFLSNIDSAPNLTEQQKKIVRRSIAKMGRKLSAAFTKVGKTSNRLEADRILRTAFFTRAAKGKRIRGKFLPMPLGGKTPANETKAIAVYQVNSYLGFLIHFLSNSNSSSSLINQLKNFASTDQAAYLEVLRTRLNQVFASSIGSVTRQTKRMFTKFYKKRASRNKQFDFMNFLVDGDNSFSFLSQSISAGTTRSPSLDFNLTTGSNTGVITLDGVRGGPISFAAVYDPTTSPPTLTFSNGSATFTSAFATFASLVGGQFALTAQLSNRSTIQNSKLLLETGYTIVSGQADITISLSVSKKGYISGEVDLNLPGLPEGFSMDACLIGYLTSTGTLELIQLAAFPTSLGTGGHQIQKYTSTT